MMDASNDFTNPFSSPNGAPKTSELNWTYSQQPTTSHDGHVSPPLPAGIDERLRFEINMDEERERLLLASIMGTTEASMFAFPPQSIIQTSTSPLYQQHFATQQKQAQSMYPPSGSYSSSSTSSNSHKRKTQTSSMPTMSYANDMPVDEHFQILENGFTMASPKIQRITHPLLSFPNTLLQAFNGGDMRKVREILTQYTVKDCWLRTPSLDNDLQGQHYIVDFFQAFSEVHPDAVWVSKKAKFHDDTQEIICRIYFAGTRVISAQPGTLSSAEQMQQSYSEYLFHRPGASLVDEMDTSLLTQPEIDAMQELEKSCDNLSVFGKGKMTLKVRDYFNLPHRCLICCGSLLFYFMQVNSSDLITHFAVEWVITSFREAEVWWVVIFLSPIRSCAYAEERSPKTNSTRI